MGFSRLARHAVAIAAIAGLTAPGFPGFASDWITLSRSAALSLDVDRETMTVANGLVTAWVRLTFPPPAKVRMDSYRIKINCTDRTAGILYREKFDAEGSSIGGISDPYARLDPIIPDTLNDTVRQRVCAPPAN